MNRPPHQSNRLVLFENRWLEKFTVVSVGWFVAIWAVIVPLVVVAAWGTFTPLAVIGLMIAGWFIWSIFEYIAHRKLFHFDTDRPWLERVVFIIHGNHHVQPRDELRNLMPPIVSVPVSMSIWALFWAIAGDAGTWMFLGFIGGYVAYDLVHYACHHWPMRGPVGRLFKRHHMRHHFITGRGNFAITAIFWDYVFGTRVAR